MAKRPLNNQLRAAAAQAGKQLASWLDTRFTEEISASKWDYPTPPQVRDIVDTAASVPAKRVSSILMARSRLAGPWSTPRKSTRAEFLLLGSGFPGAPGRKPLWRRPPRSTSASYETR